MASLIRDITVNEDSAPCWDAVRDFGALHQRLTAGFTIDCKLTSDREREVTFLSGAVAREYLVGIDDDRMRLVYSVVESPMGSSHNNSSVQVIPDGDGRCRFVWIVDVLPDEHAKRTGELMDSGLAVMKRTLEADRGES